jgi:hypothetical protein
VSAKDGSRRQGDGVFDCTPSDDLGPILRHPENPHRWVFANGELYFPVGLQDCIDVRGGHLMPKEIDGEMGRVGGLRIPLQTYFAMYGQAGFNLLRFSQRNCSYPLYDDLDHYREAEMLATDHLLASAREHGLRIMFGFFGYHDQWTPETVPMRFLKHILRPLLRTREPVVWAPHDHETLAKEKRFLDYAVARWGVYVDFWELLNERKASDEWTTLMADYVRSIDPERKPIGTSWEKPHLAAIDINAPHWYESESELQSDARVQQQAIKWKQPGKPVIVGEHGNRGMNWDPLSGLRMRIRSWTALFQEISLIFWNTSWSKTGMFYGRPRPRAVANIYVGPEERSYIRVLQNFASQLDANVRMAPVEVSAPSRVRAYGLLSQTVAAAYLHHAEDHSLVVPSVQITLALPTPQHPTDDLVGTWIEPSSGAVVARLRLPPGRQTLEVPPFSVDLSLLVAVAANRLRPIGADSNPTPQAHHTGRR